MIFSLETYQKDLGVRLPSIQRIIIYAGLPLLRCKQNSSISARIVTIVTITFLHIHQLNDPSHTLQSSFNTCCHSLLTLSDHHRAHSSSPNTMLIDVGHQLGKLGPVYTLPCETSTKPTSSRRTGRCSHWLRLTKHPGD